LTVIPEKSEGEQRRSAHRLGNGIDPSSRARRDNHVESAHEADWLEVTDPVR